MYRLFVLCCIAAVILFSTTFANDVNNGGQVGIVRTLSSHTNGKTGLHAGGTFKGGTEWDYVNGIEDRKNPILMSGDVYISYGLFKFLDISVDMPVYFDITGWKQNRGGAGDLQAAIKMTNPFQKEDAIISHAYYLKVIFPTGQEDRGYFPRHVYFSDENNKGINPFTGGLFFFNPQLIWTFDFSPLSVPLAFHLNAGGVVANTIADSKKRGVITGGIGVEYTPVLPLTIFLETNGEWKPTRYTKGFDKKALNDDAVWLTPGLKFNFPLGFYLLLAGDIGLSDNVESARISWERDGYTYSTKVTPRYGAILSFGWKGILVEEDSDKDGIIDKKDKCPKEAEDKDGFEDEDGCPDLDNDKDGFADAEDKCPDSAGTNQGCPVYDKDNDGIVDGSDKCIDLAEDKDGFEDQDGCPEADNDKDGVIDEKDNCPNVAEDADGFDDGDGCPDFDNDGDGVPDSLDKCPGVRGLPENNGCPKTKEISRGKLILSGVTFEPGKAILTTNSYTILDQVYESLVEWPEVKLEIQGHTDNVGNNIANLKLSQQRAEAVRMYLIQKGIAPDRLKAVGYGEDFPIADNKTKEGREKNRRVELRRID